MNHSGYRTIPQGTQRITVTTKPAQIHVTMTRTFQFLHLFSNKDDSGETIQVKNFGTNRHAKCCKAAKKYNIGSNKLIFKYFKSTRSVQAAAEFGIRGIQKFNEKKRVHKN